MLLLLSCDSSCQDACSIFSIIHRTRHKSLTWSMLSASDSRHCFCNHVEVRHPSGYIWNSQTPELLFLWTVKRCNLQEGNLQGRGSLDQGNLSCNPWVTRAWPSVFPWTLKPVPACKTVTCMALGDARWKQYSCGSYTSQAESTTAASSGMTR